MIPFDIFLYGSCILLLSVFASWMRIFLIQPSVKAYDTSMDSWFVFACCITTVAVVWILLGLRGLKDAEAFV